MPVERTRGAGRISSYWQPGLYKTVKGAIVKWWEENATNRLPGCRRHLCPGPPCRTAKKTISGAKELGQVLQQLEMVEQVEPVHTNIIIFHLKPEPKRMNSPENYYVIESKALPWARVTVRFVTHLDFTEAMLVRPSGYSKPSNRLFSNSEEASSKTSQLQHKMGLNTSYWNGDSKVTISQTCEPGLLVLLDFQEICSSLYSWKYQDGDLTQIMISFFTSWPIWTKFPSTFFQFRWYSQYQMIQSLDSRYKFQSVSFCDRSFFVGFAPRCY